MAVATRTVNANASSGTQNGRPCPASPYGYLLLQPTFVVQKRMSIASLAQTFDQRVNPPLGAHTIDLAVQFTACPPKQHA